MGDNEEIVRNLTNHYTYRVEKAFNNDDAASKALEVIAKSLKEIYRYFEPSFFKGDFYVCKNLNDDSCLDETKCKLLYDKNILLNKTTGNIFIQVFNDNKMILSENQDSTELVKQKETLVYYFKDNKECFFANETKIDITMYNEGSRFATQFNELVEALNHYERTKLRKSTCSHFSQSWSSSDSSRLFFRGAGRGNNIPEKFMQLSLHDFLSSYFIRGISMESSREYNINGDYSKPKPVDIRINWRESNRTAIIEVKFMGAVKKDSDGGIYNLSDARANYGITQLKGYHDTISSDLPTTIIKSYLVVIDGRRNNLSASQTTINMKDGMHYENVDIIIDSDKMFHLSIQGFEKPIRMFAEPICY